MLWIIGLGINGAKGISLHALDILKTCDKIFIERFTSQLTDSDIDELHDILYGQNKGNQIIKIVPRWYVEDGREILSMSSNEIIAILTYGDPFIATTLNELYVRAVKNSIQTGIIHAASGLTSLIGETGLHLYKFGRTVTVMSDPQSCISVYNIVHDNLKSGNHSLILTEYSNINNDNSPFFLDPKKVFQMLKEIETDVKYNVFTNDTFVIVASRIGSIKQNIIAGKIESLKDFDFGNGPHSIIVPGILHFTETDALRILSKIIDEPIDNSKLIYDISRSMVEKYIPKAKEALEQMRNYINKKSNQNEKINEGIYNVIENAEYYLYDAERFFIQKKMELSILSIGYAEGLIDSLRYQWGINPWS
ncbi:MAG: diphthine synthase [Nitrososphaeraceae archaeon]|nr:diphthine synthase [Nitrososphaeraceae archaeon]